MSDTAHAPENAPDAPVKAREGEAMPAPLKDALKDLTPMQAHAVRSYLTPGSGTFGNKTQSMLAAGYSPNTHAAKCFGRENVQRALEAFREWRLTTEASVVMKDIEAVAPDAKDELISQLDAGKGLDIIDPRSVFGEELENIRQDDERDFNRLREINKHNRVVAKFIKERREAAELLLAYAEGTPEQRMRVTQAREKSRLEKWLEDLPPEEFDQLAEELFGEETGGSDDPPVLEGDYEVLDSGHEEGDR